MPDERSPSRADQTSARAEQRPSGSGDPGPLEKVIVSQDGKKFIACPDND